MNLEEAAQIIELQKTKIKELEYNYKEVVKVAQQNQEYYAKMEIVEGETIRNRELKDRVEELEWELDRKSLEKKIGTLEDSIETVARALMEKYNG